MRRPGSQRRDELPAWPLGCGLALLALLLMVNLLGLAGIFMAGAGLPRWIEQGGAAAIALTVPLLMGLGWLLARRRNPYAARTLRWGLTLTGAFAIGLTILFNLIDRMSGL
jgi:uncharacterized protein (TIGR03382 family)